MGLKDWLFGREQARQPENPETARSAPPARVHYILRCRACSAQFPSFLARCPDKSGRCKQETALDPQRSKEFREGYEIHSRKGSATADQLAKIKHWADLYAGPTIAPMPDAPPFPAQSSTEVSAFLARLPRLVDDALRSGSKGLVFTEALSAILHMGPEQSTATWDTIRVQLLRAAGVSADFPYRSTYLARFVDSRNLGLSWVQQTWLITICMANGCIHHHLPPPYDLLHSFYKRMTLSDSQPS